MKKAVFFDLDDTLLNDRLSIQTAFDKTCQQIAKEHQLNAQEIEKQVRLAARESYANYPFYKFTTEIGINPFEGLWGQFTDVHHYKFREMGENILDYQTEAWVNGLKSFNLTEDVAIEARDMFKKVRRQSPFLFEETIDVLETLKENNLKMLLLTNGAPSLQLEKLAMTPELVPYFDHIVISGNIGFGKPSPVIFAHCLRLMGIKNHDAIMIGDNINTDILGASQIGMESIWIDLKDGVENPNAYPTYTVERLKEILPHIIK